MKPAKKEVTSDFVLRRLLHRIEHSKTLGLALAGGLLMLIGLLDYFTGYEIGFALFYLFPVMISTWVAGRWAGIVAAVVSALLWLLADFATGHPYYQPLSPFWNATMRLGIFAVIAQLVMYVRDMIEFERTMSRTDHLTGIPNRRAFSEALVSESKRSERFHHAFSLVYIDVDDFKKLNDKEGHKTGDEALCLIARTLVRNLRNVDLVARIGGDEFAILLPESDRASATEVVNRCIAISSQKIQSRDWSISLSVGVGIFNRGDRTVDQLLACADEVMYQSKCSGKNRIHYVSFEEQDAVKTRNGTVEQTDKSRSETSNAH